MRTFYIIFFLLLAGFSFSQGWTKEQIAAANTVKDITSISKEEKAVIVCINLARLYPKDFARIEVMTYTGTPRYKNKVDLENSTYKKTLLKELNSMSPLKALVFDQGGYDNAKCLSKEQSVSGEVGHKRKKCVNGLYAECCSYGENEAIPIVMQWLIDENVEDLSHRNNCLDKYLSKIGICIYTHQKYKFSAIADFK
jgi:hypothetical protein